MSAIVTAVIKKNVTFLSEEDLREALGRVEEEVGYRYHIMESGRIEIEGGLILEKQNNGYTAIFKGFEEEKKRVMEILSCIERVYSNILEERIKAKKYEESRLQEIMDEEERKKKELLLSRERKKLERQRRKEEEIKRRSIEKKIEQLKARARSMGYEIEERIEKNEKRVLVLVRRK